MPCPLHQGLDMCQSYLQSNSTPVRSALSLFSQRKPVCSGTQQRGCQAAGWRLVYPAEPREALTLRPGSGGCGEEWHLTQAGRQQTGGRARSSSSQPRQGSDRTGGGDETHVIEYCATGGSGRQLTVAPWSLPASGIPPSLPFFPLLFQPEGVGACSRSLSLL